ncbi:MAG: pyridoxal-phosphate-dependent aminotransferase family protein [Candidatus Thorarchaeota archaeon]
MSSIHFNKEKGSPLKLFTPGPVQVSTRILEEMAKPNDTHRSKPYEEMHQLAIEGLQKILFTKSHCLLFTSSGSGIMEACVRNLIKHDEKGLFLSIGAFGDRWYQTGLANGKIAMKADVEWGKALTPDYIQELLSKDKYSVAFLQSNETSTGVYNPLEEIIPIIKENNILVCVDATSSMAGIKIDVDKLRIDVCLASVQKCFALPPGLAVCSISEDAIEKASQVKNRGFYFDFLTLTKKNEVNQTPTTPPIPQIRGLVAQLDYILNKEGLLNRFRRHEQLGKNTRSWVKKVGLRMFSEKGHESNTVSTIKNNLKLDIKQLVNNMLEKGYRIVNGYGHLRNSTFRIGHMGDTTLRQLDAMLQVLEETIIKNKDEK